MLEVLILALALSMDAFAVSVGLGSKKSKKPKSLSFLVSAYFGSFQGLMPLIGYLGSKKVIGWAENCANWIAFSLLLLVGGKMIYESMTKGIEDNIVHITHRAMLMLSIATSIDAMTAGLTLHLLEVNPLTACGIIGLVTSLFSWAGVFVGAKSGAWLESKAELLGGVILVAISFKFLYF